MGQITSKLPWGSLSDFNVCEEFLYLPFLYIFQTYPNTCGSPAVTLTCLNGFINRIAFTLHVSLNLWRCSAVCLKWFFLLVYKCLLTFKLKCHPFRESHPPWSHAISGRSSYTYPVPPAAGSVITIKWLLIRAGESNNPRFEYQFSFYALYWPWTVTYHFGDLCFSSLKVILM